ncbi:MAG TPA: response regulator [Gemmataceae bacterium]|jgi:CheY-like chemotaxis protein/anti-sigma regulatory factor (Ser/Thr protein kinase)|nr:response regulator [Gemmataceae bacterium]
MSPLDPAAPDAGPAAAAGHTVLIVDDSPMDRHLAGAIVQKMDGWKAAFAADGNEALAAIERQRPDVVLTDMLMPEMDGLQLVQAVHAKYPLVPVILMTAHGSEDLAIRALQSGAASYVPKKSLARDLAETLEQVRNASQAQRGQRRILDSLTQLESHFVLENDTALIPALVGHLEGDLERMRLAEPSGLILLGVALHEALTNAVLHGNLEIRSELRETDEKQYHRQAVERRTQAPYGDRRVFLTATLTRHEATFVVRDEGSGFDPALLPDPTDPANLGRVSGRGLLLIQTFMDRVEHNERGNQITMIKHRG